MHTLFSCPVWICIRRNIQRAFWLSWLKASPLRAAEAAREFMEWQLGGLVSACASLWPPGLFLTTPDRRCHCSACSGTAWLLCRAVVEELEEMLSLMCKRAAVVRLALSLALWVCVFSIDRGYSTSNKQSACHIGHVKSNYFFSASLPLEFPHLSIPKEIQMGSVLSQTMSVLLSSNSRAVFLF